MTTEITVLPGWVLRDAQTSRILALTNQTYTLSPGESLAFTLARVLAGETERKVVIIEDQTSNNPKRPNRAVLRKGDHRFFGKAVVRAGQTFSPQEVHFAHGATFTVK